MTFSKKGTKITPQTHIRKFEILNFSDNNSKITMIHNFLTASYRSRGPRNRKVVAVGVVMYSYLLTS